MSRIRQRHAFQNQRPKAEMNLTSVMDLTFILLITFIITFPLIEQGFPVSLPKGKAQELPQEAKPAVVSVSAQNRIYLGENLVTLEELKSALATQQLNQPDLQLIIRGDQQVSYGAVIEVAQIAHDLGISKLSLAIEPQE